MDSKLNNDLKIKILLRTSLKTLDAMSCTSKEFEKLTYHPHLINLFKKRNDIVSGIIVETNNKSENYINEFAPSSGSKYIDLSFLPHNARIKASSEHGIVVFETSDSKSYGLNSYYVCKLATKQVLALPNPKTKYLTQKVAIIVLNSNPLHYKIVRLSRPVYPISQTQDKLYTAYRCEIFNSRTWSWKLQNLLKLPFRVFPTYPQPITARGSIYMLLTNNNILKFDAYSEIWSIFLSPVSDHRGYEFRQLVKYEGRLGFGCKRLDGSWEIWVLGINELWKKINVFGEDEDVNARKRLNEVHSSTILVYNGSTFDKVVVTDIRSYKFFVYRSDFEPTDLTGKLE
ncbi:hypothetical protein LXL04_018589 [Taraxacum kok-saghyz]